MSFYGEDISEVRIEEVFNKVASQHYGAFRNIIEHYGDEFCFMQCYLYSDSLEITYEHVEDENRTLNFTVTTSGDFEFSDCCD